MLNDNLNSKLGSFASFLIPYLPSIYETSNKFSKLIIIMAERSVCFPSRGYEVFMKLWMKHCSV